MSGGANLSSAAVFNPGSIHASRAYVDAVLSGEAGNRSAADDALTIAIQDVDTKLSVHAAGSSHVTQQEKSAWNSKCPLEDGKVPAANLPSFVDDVVEAGDSTLFPRTGETGKIYVARDTNKTYRWGGSGYVEISQSLALGETSSTAYPGNKGKANAEAIASEASRAHRVEELILQAISEFLKDASVSQDGKTLTITKKNGTTVQFQGGSSAWDDITDKPQSFTPSAHASSHANGGTDAITPQNIGAVAQTIVGDTSSTYLGSPESSELTIESQYGSITLKSGRDGVTIKKGTKEVATEEFAAEFGLYPFKNVTGGAILDRTSNQGDADTTAYTLPSARADGGPRDFELVIDLSSASADVTITISPASGETVSLKPADDSTFKVAKEKLNILWFHEAKSGGVFAVRRAEY